MAPNTLTKTSHGMSLSALPGGAQAAGGRRVIGAVNGWNPSQSLDVTAVFEFRRGAGGGGGRFNPEGLYGVPYEKVPGNISGMTLQVTRYDLYSDLMEEAFGTPRLDMLSKQINAFSASEDWQVPDADGGVRENYKRNYLGLWFSNIGRQYSADGQRTVNVNASIEYTYTQLVRA